MYSQSEASKFQIRALETHCTPPAAPPPPEFLHESTRRDFRRVDSPRLNGAANLEIKVCF